MSAYNRIIGLILTILFVTNINTFAGGTKSKPVIVLKKIKGREHRKEGIHDGNNVLTIFYN